MTARVDNYINCIGVLAVGIRNFLQSLSLEDFSRQVTWYADRLHTSVFAGTVYRCVHISVWS